MKKKEKKEKKKIRSIIKNEFPGIQKNRNIMEFLVDSSFINKKVMKRDKKNLETSQAPYYENLFNEFKNLVKKENSALQFKADELNLAISGLKAELKELEEKKAEKQHA
jgi:hypothetical protein